MTKFPTFKDLNQEEVMLYSLLAIVILTTALFLVIYLLWVPFWPARIAHIIYITFNISLIYFVKKKNYTFVKVSILASNVVQLAIATFIWFPLSTNYALFYFLLPMGSFATMNLLDQKERLFAFFISFISLSLFIVHHYFGVNYYLYEISGFAESIISFLTAVSTMIILIIYFYLHAHFLALKSVDLEYLANTDSLTDIFNRRNFYRLSEVEFQLAHKYNHTFSLLLLDLDDFKSINDTFGHNAGDEVLRELSKTIKNTIRHNDIFARHGGEEFTLLLRQTQAETGIKIAEKIRHNIEAMEVISETGSIKITASIGVTQFSNRFDHFDQLVMLADEALYDAKEKGRNCVVYKK